MASKGGLVRAAGGILHRRDADGVDRFAVVHRPRYDDWSFPKGKLVGDEGWEQAARREVVEETGLVCELVRELPPVEYQDRHGRPKQVRYWLMVPVSGEFAPGDEVDEFRWLPMAEALATLSYEHDRRLLGSLNPGTAP